jgi:cyclic pyranopterin phosphate synthase
MALEPVGDRLSRPLRNLRVSVTDRCNLRCAYCMPEAEYVWLAREAILSFEEIAALADAFALVGVDKVRLTGGEPLLRRGLASLVSLLAARGAIRDLALTTNGILLAEQAAALRDAGLHRVTVSLDTLRPETFRRLAQRDELPAVLSGIDAAARARFPGALKIDTVVLRGVNDGEIGDLVEHGKRVGAEVRFIEYMDVGGATRWSMRHVVPRREILDVLERRYGRATPIAERASAPAERFALPDGTTVGIIASTTAPFCRDCDRGRLTADGQFFLCLYATRGTDLRKLLRGGANSEEIAAAIASVWRARDDRGAEVRLAAQDRSPLAPREALRENPHLEMHTRGG